MNIGELIQIGYEQQPSSDFGDALQTYKERHTEETLTIDGIEAAAIAWQNEFKEIVDIEWYRRNMNYIK
jgi:hypothetical protein